MSLKYINETFAGKTIILKKKYDTHPVFRINVVDVVSSGFRGKYEMIEYNGKILTLRSQEELRLTKDRIGVFFWDEIEELKVLN